MAITLRVNGEDRAVNASPDTPLLYVLRDELGLRNPRFGCGLAQCGACTVHLDGQVTRSCVTPVSMAAGKRVTTLEGLAATSGRELHPVQQAFIDEQAMQCGYCLNAWIMTAAALLERTPDPTDAEIRQGLTGLKCRCGSHLSVLRAVKRAAQLMKT